LRVHNTTPVFSAANCGIMQEISELLYRQTLRTWHLTFDESDAMSEVEMETKEIEETITSLAKRKPEAAQQLRREIIMAWVDRLHKYFTRY